MQRRSSHLGGPRDCSGEETGARPIGDEDEHWPAQTACRTQQCEKLRLLLVFRNPPYLQTKTRGHARPAAGDNNCRPPQQRQARTLQPVRHRGRHDHTLRRMWKCMEQRAHLPRCATTSRTHTRDQLLRFVHDHRHQMAKHQLPLTLDHHSHQASRRRKHELRAGREAVGDGWEGNAARHECCSHVWDATRQTLGESLELGAQLSGGGQHNCQHGCRALR
mmetsp:Transcript_24410/g.78419  ORF Transcript_24410/g.78419 Transcript_24410/m.78419 type:complete len:220 (+) Transcript_24410:541-1200(+)